MRKTLRMMLLTALAVVLGSASAKAETTVKWEAASASSIASAIALDENISLTFVEGGGDQAPRLNAAGYVYFYNGNRLTLSAANDATITKIAFSFSQGSNSLEVYSGGGSVSGGIWTGESSAVTLRAARSTGARYISAIEVTYQKAGETPVEKFADLTITATPNTTADLDNTPSVFATVRNSGDVAADDVVVKLFVDGEENAQTTVSGVNVGGQQYATVYYDAEKIEAGEHEVYLTVEASNDNAESTLSKQTETVTVTFTKKAPEASFSVTADDVVVAYDAESYTVVAKVSNTSTVDATGVVVSLYESGDVIATATVDVAAGETVEAELTVNGGPFAAGRTQKQVVVGTATKWVWVVVEEAPVAEVKDLAVQMINGSIDLGAETNTLTVTIQNNGNVVVEDAVVTVKAADQVLGTATLTANLGFNSCQVSVSKDGLEAGELAVTATVEVEGDATPDDNTYTGTITVKAAVAPEATYELSAADVTVQLPAETMTVVVTVKNTSEVDAAEGIAVNLVQGINTLGTQTTKALKAGEADELTFEVENPFTTDGEYQLQALTEGNKYGCYIKVVVEPAPVVPVIDMAITAIQGVSEINLQEENTVQVWYENLSNVDLTDVAINLSVNDHGQTTTVESIPAGRGGYVSFTIPTDIFEPGEDTEAEIIAWVNIDDDVDATNNRVVKTVPVIDGVAPEATFAVEAEPVEVEYGAETFEVVVKVTNTSEVEANDVEVVLYNKGIENPMTFVIETLAAGETKPVVFTVVNDYVPGSYEWQIIVANKTEARVQVTVQEEEVVPVVDLAITAVNGTIDLNAESNTVSVYVENRGTVDVEDALVSIATTDGTVLGTATLSVKAGQSRLVSVAIDAEGLADAELQIVVKVEVEGDATPENNEFEKTLAVTTGISSIEAVGGSDARVYTLGGQKVGTATKAGIYVVDGRKVVVK